MPDISSIGHGSVGPLDRTASTAGRRDNAPPHPDSLRTDPRRLSDSVEVSDHARWLDQLRRLPDVRQDRVDQIKADLAEGSYETEEKLDTAIDRLIEDILLE